MVVCRNDDAAKTTTTVQSSSSILRFLMEFLARPPNVNEFSPPRVNEKKSSGYLAVTPEGDGGDFPPPFPSPARIQFTLSPTAL